MSYNSNFFLQFMKMYHSGEVLLSVQYADHHLSVFINKARGLTQVDQDKVLNPYVRVCLISGTTNYPNKKTEIKKNTLNPVFRQTCKVSLIFN